jgi:SAM-dependent methyltransferase
MAAASVPRGNGGIFDVSPTLRVQRIPFIERHLVRDCVAFPPSVEYGDVTRGLPIATASASAVYCSHTLEHLSLEDLRKALAETYRVLRPGGTFRGVLPDLDYYARTYLADPSSRAALSFMERTLLGKRRRSKGLSGFVTEWFGNSHHLWMWDYKGLADELAAAGFRGIRRPSFGDNPDPAFGSVKDEERWVDCLGFECRR